MKLTIDPQYDLTGKRFGDLLVIEYVGHNKKMGATWKCKCKCGKFVLRGGNRLRKIKGGYPCEFLHIGGGPAGKDFEAAIKTHIFLKMKHQALFRGKTFSITKDDVYSLIDKPCHYCGKIGSNSTSVPKKQSKAYIGKRYAYNGLDRIDSSKGYIPSNVVPCCKECNWGKNSLHSQAYITHCVKVVVHQLVRAFPSGHVVIEFLRSHFKI